MLKKSIQRNESKKQTKAKLTSPLLNQSNEIINGHQFNGTKVTEFNQTTPNVAPLCSVIYYNKADEDSIPKFTYLVYLLQLLFNEMELPKEAIIATTIYFDRILHMGNMQVLSSNWRRVSVYIGYTRFGHVKQ